MAGKTGKMRMMGRKDAIISFNFVSMIPRIIFLVIMLMACVILIRLFINNKFDTNDTEAEIFIAGLIYGTGGVSYTDPLTGRTYPEVIDLAQLNSSELDAGFYRGDNRFIAAKISVLADRDDETPVKTVYYNREWYDNWRPLLVLQLPGIGGVEDYVRTLPVIYRNDEGVLNAGYVEYQVVQPRG